MKTRDRSPAAGTESSEAAATEHRSLAFEVLLERLEKAGASRILDLGPALGENVSFLSTLPAKIFIADLPQVIGGPETEDLDAQLARDFPSFENEPVDAVLAWDLLNYLTAEEIGRLGRRLAVLCRPGALLFALVSTEHQIPDRPSLFRITGRDSLLYEPVSHLRRPGPHYTEPDLTRWLKEFEVDITFLLRHGIQEYLFARRARPAAAH